jgi:hypothetical protein
MYDSIGNSKGGRKLTELQSLVGASPSQRVLQAERWPIHQEAMSRSAPFPALSLSHQTETSPVIAQNRSTHQ